LSSSEAARAALIFAGFQLRNDDNLLARQAMFSLSSEAYAHNFTVITDDLIEPGKSTTRPSASHSSVMQRRSLPPFRQRRG